MPICHALFRSPIGLRYSYSLKYITIPSKSMTIKAMESKNLEKWTDKMKEL